jgi:hypothetical protein
LSVLRIADQPVGVLCGDIMQDDPKLERLKNAQAIALSRIAELEQHELWLRQQGEIPLAESAAEERRTALEILDIVDRALRDLLFASRDQP